MRHHKRISLRVLDDRINHAVVERKPAAAEHVPDQHDDVVARELSEVQSDGVRHAGSKSVKEEAPSNDKPHDPLQSDKCVYKLLLVRTQERRIINVVDEHE